MFKRIRPLEASHGRGFIFWRADRMIFFSYYPTYNDLDILIEKYKPSKVNIYVDLKNCITGMYNEDSMKDIIKMNEGTTQPILDLFLSWVDFVSFHYNYMIKNKMPLYIYNFSDIGDSIYHKKIYKEYKSNRTITRSKTMSFFEEDGINKIIKNNIEKIHEASKKMFHCYSVDLRFCESDFVPYYIIKNFNQDNNSLNIIYSSDSDMLQCIELENTVVFFRRNKDNKKMLDKDNWYERVKLENFDIKNAVYFKSITGDTSDSIPGIDGIGPKKAFSVLKELQPTSLDNLKESLVKFDNKISNVILDSWDIIERNYKLISFKELSNSISLEVSDKINNIFKNNENKFTLNASIDFIDKIKERLGG